MKEKDRGAEIYERVGKGDEEAFEELFRMYSKAMVNYSYRFLGNWGEAEEAAQEVFLRLYRTAPRYERKAAFSTFLYQVATNLLINWRRDQARERGTAAFADLEEVLGREPGLEEELDRRALMSRVSRGLDRLPERERAALVMVAMEGFSYTEAAEAMQTSFRAVKSLVHRGRERIRRILIMKEGKNEVQPGR